MNKQRESRREPGSQGIGGYLLPMLLSAAVGAAVMWLVMSQRSSPVTKPAAFVPPSAAQNTSAAPAAPDLSGVSAADAAVVRGNLAYDHQQWAEAIRQYQEAIAKGRDNADVRTDLGNAFRFSGQPEKALEQYTIAQRQDPQHENSLFNQIGLFIEVMHDPIRAIPVCEEFIRRFPSSEKVAKVKQHLQEAKSL
jgi:tetratricopeptide (TPR) repeat protein